ncbi:MAG: DNA polymerase III subunit delta' [Bacteroidales bacterium]|nr:DNA polymerase III subunit delta' [Bacteroidales bacterium]
MAWDSIRGHDGPRSQLAQAVQAGRLAHAYLFVGPEGIGKHRFATELAKTVLCEASPGPMRACDRCPACIQVQAHTHPDCFSVRRAEDKNELDVDTMREFCHRLALKSTRGSRKVGIVEEADEFNVNSANSFLKPLEEPPAGSLLILLATSLERQLPTILSRCQVVHFSPLTPEDVRAVLLAHGVQDPQRLNHLVRLSGGSPGRALALHEESFWSFRQTLLEALTAPRPDAVGLAATWIKFAEEAGKQGPAQRRRTVLAIGMLIELLQTALRVAFGNDAEAPDPMNAPEAERLRPFAERLGVDSIADNLEACLEAERQIERYLQIGLVLEGLLNKLFPLPVPQRSR